MMDKQKFVEMTEGGQATGKIKEDSIPMAPQNGCFRTNITELKKTKQQLQEKSLKLMAFK